MTRRRITLRNVDEEFRARRPFQCNRTLKGYAGPPRQYGWLTFPWVNHIRQFELLITYTVESYYTPIAWVMKNGQVIVPPLKHSQSTQRHVRSLGLRYTEPRREEVAA